MNTLYETDLRENKRTNPEEKGKTGLAVAFSKTIRQGKSETNTVSDANYFC
jgi:hypothetical protein